MAIPFHNQIEILTPPSNPNELIRLTDGVVSDDIRKVVAMTYAEYQALEEKDEHTLYKITDAGDITGMPVIAVPDYENMETVNRITALDTPWVVEQTGYVRVRLSVNVTSPTGYVLGTVVINNRDISLGTGTADKDNLLRFDPAPIPVKKGDSIYFKVSNDGSGATWTTGYIRCYFIPMTFIEALPPKISEDFMNYMAVPDNVNRELVNLITTIDGSWKADRTGFVYIDARIVTTDSNQSIIVYESIRDVNHRLRMERSDNASGGNVRLTDVFPISKGDTIYVERNSGTTFTSIQCNFIPPKFVQLSAPVISEDFRNYLAVPDTAKPVVSSNVIKDAASYSWTVVANGYAQAWAIMPSEDSLSISHNDRNLISLTGTRINLLFPVKTGDIVKVNFTDTLTPTNIGCTWVPATFADVAKPANDFDMSKYTITDNIEVNFYCSPSGVDTNDGLTATTPKRNIQALFNTWSKQPLVWPSEYRFRINLAAGDYTLPDSYVMPPLNRMLTIVGVSLATTTINVNGVGTHAWLIRSPISLRNLTIKGACDTASTGLVAIQVVATAFINYVRFVGTNKTVNYFGLSTILVGNFYIDRYAFQNLPVALTGQGETIFLRTPLTTDGGNASNNQFVILDNAVLVLSTYSSSFAAIFSNNVVSGSRVISSGDGVYSTSVEQLTGEIWLGSLVYKRTVNTGVLPNNTSKPVVHSISNLEWVIKLEGIARNINGSFITADRPGDSAGAGHWRISADTTNIYLAATSDMTAYTESYVTLYYTKTA